MSCIKYSGARPWDVSYERKSILKSVLAWMENQCREAQAGVIWSNSWVLVIIRPAVFWTWWIFFNREAFKPERRTLQEPVGEEERLVENEIVGVGLKSWTVWHTFMWNRQSLWSCNGIHAKKKKEKEETVLQKCDYFEKTLTHLLCTYLEKK